MTPCAFPIPTPDGRASESSIPWAGPDLGVRLQEQQPTQPLKSMKAGASEKRFRAASAESATSRSNSSTNSSRSRSRTGARIDGAAQSQERDRNRDRNRDQTPAHRTSFRRPSCSITPSATAVDFDAVAQEGRRCLKHVPCVYKIQPLLASARAVSLGAVRSSLLPRYPADGNSDEDDDSMATKTPSPQPAGVPATPRIISPTPTPSRGGRDPADGYFGPVTRSVARRRVKSPSPGDDDDDDERQNGAAVRAQTRSRSSESDGRSRRRGGLFRGKSDGGGGSGAAGTTNERLARKGKEPSSSSSSTTPAMANGASVNGHLKPSSADGRGCGSWRGISRSPSPLGLIPIHRHWRSFVHRHEIPRKMLHVSIGFITLYLYTSGVRTATITPYILYGLLPIFSVDVLRHRWPALNRLYIGVCGALMRESEVDSFNGVVWYLVGAYVALRFFPKDVGVMAVLLLSWCDTAASTVGRAYGRYTPRIRRGKTVAGSIAACFVGVLTALAFWGWLAPRTNPLIVDMDDTDPSGAFMFTGRLALPEPIRRALSSASASHLLPAGLAAHLLPPTSTSISGGVALAVVSVWTGFVGAASEVIDLWGWDDNMTIPILSGIGLWGFLRVFGA